MKFSHFGPEFFVEAALRVERTLELAPGRREAFAAAVSARAVFAERRDVDRSLRVAPDWPGYLHRRLEGRDIFVPFNLAFALPGHRILIGAIELAEAVRLGYGHPICLSGSTTFLGRLDKAADLDFCEYYPSAPGTLAPAIRDKASVADQPYLIRLKCAGADVSLPCDDLSSRLDQIHHAAMSHDKPSVKLDFVGVSASFGIVPVTSVVLMVDRRDFEQGRGQASFAYQEVVTCAARPPRSLFLIPEFARYFIWLKADAARWLQKKSGRDGKAPLKSLKRCLSLIMLIGDDLLMEAIPSLADALPETGVRFSTAELILSSLNEGTLARVADDLRLAELRQMAPLGHGLVPESILQDIHRREFLPDEVVDIALDAARTLAEGLVSVIGEYCDRVGAGLT